MDGIFGGRRIILAPMAGVTDAPFRHICTENGADLVFTEMVSAKGLSFANEKTRHIVDLGPNETSVSVQIFGHEPSIMAEQAKWIEDELEDALISIDINMGCPARKIVSKGDGSALMKDPLLAAEIMETVKGAVSHPVTCKFRRGWDESIEYMKAPDFAYAMQEAGADCVTIHGRYSTQMYKGSSDRECIRQAKENVRIPVVGNGDVKSAKDALELAGETQCDAIMIARRAQGYPWIFSEVKSAIDGDLSFQAPSSIERLNMIRHHLELAQDMTTGDLRGMRKHAMSYVFGMPGAPQARAAFSACSSLEDYERVILRLEEASHAA